MAQQVFTDVSDEALSKVSLDHFFDSLTCFSILPDVEVDETKAITRMMSPGIPNWLTNAVFNCRLESNSVDKVIDETIRFFASEGVAPYWRVCPHDSPTNLEDYLIAKGFELKDEQIAMSVELERLNIKVATSNNVSIEHITKASEMREKHISFTQVKANSGKSFITLMLHLFDICGYGSKADWQHYVAILDGKPVGCASAFYATGVVGIYNVGTLSEARQQGIGSALTMRCLLDARKRGYRIGTLQSSQMGYSMYQKIGFKTHFVIKYYAPTSVRNV